jgi:hypothetical protein
MISKIRVLINGMDFEALAYETLLLGQRRWLEYSSLNECSVVPEFFTPCGDLEG